MKKKKRFCNVEDINFMLCNWKLKAKLESWNKTKNIKN